MSDLAKTQSKAPEAAASRRERSRPPQTEKLPLVDLQRAAGNRATADLLGGGGQSLESGVRRDLERAYGVHLDDVRVHTDDASARVADALGARAYTSGRNIVFARGEYAPDTTSGRRLVAHEVAHVVQQASAPTRADVVGAPRGPAEQRAESAATHVVTGQAPGPIGDSGGAGIQREEAKSPYGAGSIRKFIAEALSNGLPGGTMSRLMFAIVNGLADKLISMWSKGEFAGFLAKVAASSAGDKAKFYGGYVAGLAEGIVSPITDLFSLAVLGEHVQGIVTKVAANVIAGSEALANTGRDLIASIKALGGKVWKTLNELKSKALEVITELLAGASLTEIMERKAYAFGEGAAVDIKSALDEGAGLKQPDEAPAKDKESGGFKPFTWISEKASAAKDKVISAPWAKLGNKIGYAIGAVGVNIALFLVSDGIGNAIVKLAGKIGEFGKVFAVIGKGVAAVGRAITAVEEGVAVIANVVIKPLKPLLEPILEVLGKLRTFLRELLGLEQKAATTVVEAGAKKLAGEVSAGTAPKSVAPPPKTPPHVPEKTPVIPSDKEAALAMQQEKQAAKAVKGEPGPATAKPAGELEPVGAPQKPKTAATSAEPPKKEPLKPPQPAEKPKAPEQTKAAEPPKSGEQPKAAEQPKATEEPSAEKPKTAEQAKPAEEAKTTEPSAGGVNKATLQNRFDELDQELKALRKQQQALLDERQSPSGKKNKDLIDIDRDRVRERIKQIEMEKRALDEELNPQKYPKSSTAKGDIGELKADGKMNDLGYDWMASCKKPVTGAGRPQGLDGVYRNRKPPPKFVVGEAKYGSAELSAEQKTEEWVESNLKQALGNDLAAEVRLEGYEYWKLHFDPATGTVTPTKILTAVPKK